MSSSHQRRKRKRILRQPLSFLLQLFSVRTLLLCFSFLTLLYLLPYAFPFTSSAFRPVLVVPTLSLLSSSSSATTAKSVQDSGAFLLPLEIESRVLFPDHVLLMVSGGKKEEVVKNGGGERLECVYFGKEDDFITARDRNYSFGVEKVLSLDEYDEFRIIVRCPLPPFGNFSAEVNLRWNGIFEDSSWLNNKSAGYSSWDSLAYAGVVDESSVVVFVKGLNLRANRESNPNQFACHFTLGERDRYVIRTKAIAAAQEVVRCALPQSFDGDGERVEGVRVAVSVQNRGYGSMLVPSVAKVSSLGKERRGRRRSEGKYELCVCTMVWNQAPAMREWIMYHSWLGVERWFVYDNNSEDGIKGVVQELDLENYNVTRHVWPWIKTQEAGFSHCAVRAKDECNWISFMDVDEYFYFPYSTPKHQRFRKAGYAMQNSLRTLVSNVSSWSRSVAEIRTSCHSFGPSGLSLVPPQGVTVGYTCRLQSPERHKSMIRADALDRTLLNVVHHFRLKKGYKYFNLRR